MVNEETLHERKRLQDIAAALAESQALSSDDRKWLRKLATRYGVPIKLHEENLNPDSPAPLLRRVDIVRPSLALAKAAIESAYGSSRFVVEGNALFGQWHLGKGLVPEKKRSELGNYRVASFESPRDSIRAYMSNLNTNAAYFSFRYLRAAARRDIEKLRVALLADGLLAYSEKGPAYVKLFRSLMAQNSLSATNIAKLKNHQASRF